MKWAAWYLKMTEELGWDVSCRELPSGRYLARAIRGDHICLTEDDNEFGASIGLHRLARFVWRMAGPFAGQVVSLAEPARRVRPGDYLVTQNRCSAGVMLAPIQKDECSGEFYRSGRPVFLHWNHVGLLELIPEVCLNA